MVRTDGRRADIFVRLAFDSGVPAGRVPRTTYPYAGAATMPDIIPSVKVNDQSAAEANIIAVEDAIATWRVQAQTQGAGGRILFPPGKIWISRTLWLHETEAGIVVEGQGWNQRTLPDGQTAFDPGATGNTVLLNTADTYPDSITLGVLSRNIGYVDNATYGELPTNMATLAMNIDPTPYAVGDYVFLFRQSTSGSERAPCQTLKITANDLGSPATLTFETEINQPSSVYNALKYLKHSRKVSGDVVPGATSVTLAGDEPDDADLFAVGDYALLSDGVGVNEVVGEYVKITSIEVIDATVTIRFLSGVKGVNGATYANDQTVLIPGPWAKGITLRNLQVGGSMNTNPDSAVILKYALDLTAENLRNWQGDLGVVAHGFGMTTCAHASLWNCPLELGIALNSSHDLRFNGCVINGPVAEEWARDLSFVNCEIITFCHVQTHSYALRFAGCRFSDMTTDSAFVLEGAGQHTLLNCQFVNGPGSQKFVRGGSSTVGHIGGDGLLHIGGLGNTVFDITMNAVVLEAGSGGTVVPPINPSAYFEDVPADNWAIKIIGNVAFFGVTPAGQQTGGAAMAGSTYGGTEQAMLQKAYDCLRTFGLMT
jgi:hypothetical protein